MQRLWMFLIGLFLVAVVAAGCTRSQKGAAIGAGTGAAVGGVATDSVGGAAAGGAMGAGAGYLIGKSQEDDDDD